MERLKKKDDIFINKNITKLSMHDQHWSIN